MFNKILFAVAFLGNATLFAQEGVLKIQVTDKINGEALELASVLLESAGVTAGTGTSDGNGNLVFKNLSSGKYNVKAMYTGYPTYILKDVLIINNETTYLDIVLASNNIIDGFEITEYYRKPLVNPDITVKTIFTDDDIKVSPYTKVEDFMSMVSGSVQPKEGMTPHFRAGREGSVIYIIDGNKSIGTHGVPMSSIRQMSVTLGGVPAKYGDATGAFIEIETKSGLVNPNR